MNKTLFSWLRASGLLLFVYIATQISWITVWGMMRGLELRYIAGFFILYGISFGIKVLRLRWFLQKIGHEISFKTIYASVVKSGFYGMITPARVGEFSKVFYLVRSGMQKSEAWGVVLIERFVDFSVLLMASCVGVLYFFVWRDISNSVLTIVVIAMCLVLILVLSNIGVILKKLSQISKMAISIASIDESTLNAMQLQGRIGATMVFPLSLVVLVSSFLQLWMLGAGLGITAGALYLGLAYTTSSILSLLPISIGGLGTREAVYVALLNQMGVNSSAAVMISLLDGLILPLIVHFTLFLPYLKVRHSDE